MFEKEAEEYTGNVLKGVNCNIGHPRARQINSIDVEEAYQKGAVFGYNKANEWQYVSEKGIPKEKGKYHVWLGNCSYEVTYFDGTRLWIVSDDPVDGWIDLKDVIAWQEIVLPKEDF